MFRMSCTALVVLFLAVPAFAQHAEFTRCAESPVHLEVMATKIMLKAFQVDDYETVEMLYDKLPLESKKKFLYEATEMATLDIEKAINEGNKNMTFADMIFVSRAATLGTTDDLNTACQIYMQAKGKQTQFLGRLTASLLEQQKPKVAQKEGKVEKNVLLEYQTPPHKRW